MKKKTWSRKNIVTDVGPCKYCNVMISNTDSFVALVKEKFRVTKLKDGETPNSRYCFSMLLDTQWYKLEAKKAHPTMGLRRSIFSSGFSGPQ